MKNSPFIQGFKETNLSKDALVLLADVRGDGESKLVVWSQQQSKIIVYKGQNRQVEKVSNLKNVNGIIKYHEKSQGDQAVICLSSQDGFYIFRKLSESFRLKIRKILGDVDQQIIWTKYSNQPEILMNQFMNMNHSLLSQTAKSYIGSQSIDRKNQIIAKVFKDGIYQKDSICAMGLMSSQGNQNYGNIILGTQINRLYILDEYGHSIISQRIIAFAPCFIFGNGNFHDKYQIICVSRQGDIALYLQKNENEYSELIRMNKRIVSCSLLYPQFIIATCNNYITIFNITSSTLKILNIKYSIKLNQEIIKIDLVKIKDNRIIIVAFKKQFRLYFQKQLIYQHQTNSLLSNFIFGSFCREENCLILFYQKNGFQVFIIHRKFDPHQNYGSNKNHLLNQNQFVMPKKNNYFKQQFWQNNLNNQNLVLKAYQRGLRLLKWRTLRERLSQHKGNDTNLQITSKILGLGPHFLIKLQLQSTSDEPIFNISMILWYNMDGIKIQKKTQKIAMLVPNMTYLEEIKLISLSCKSQIIQVEFSWTNKCISSIVCIPNCQQFAEK